MAHFLIDIDMHGVHYPPIPAATRAGQGSKTMAIQYTSTRKAILEHLTNAASEIGDIDASGIEGAEARKEAADMLIFKFELMLSQILRAAGHGDHISGICDCMADMAGDHLHCLTEDLVEAREEQAPIDPHAEHRLSARQLGVGRAA